MGITTGLTTLDSYSNTTAITDNAVDIFIYDTSKDSDGGAWRKRTQHTSWYNEASSSTRGSRKEFPAVAVIITNTSADTITIYDGDTPDLDMWMVFVVGNQGMASRVMCQYTGTDKNVAMLNAVLMIGHRTSSDNYGSPIINFISEDVVRADPHVGEGGVWLGTIATRNDSSGYVASSRTKIIINSIINDVAMTVLPNAPIDSATGLPIPTIAVATDGGVSVIKDDGTVINRDEAWSASGGGVHTISFDNDNGYWYTNSYYGPGSGVPSHGAILGHSSSIDTTGNLAASSGSNYSELMLAIGSDDGGTTTHWSSGTMSGLWMNHGGDSTQANAGYMHIMPNGDFSNRYGLHKFLPNYTTHSASSVAYITSDYNTGYMTGAIKGAWNVNTDVTSLGTELATGTWSGYGSNVTISGGVITCSGSTDVIRQTSVVPVIGKAYTASFDLNRTSGTVYVNFGHIWVTAAYSTASTGSHSFSFTPTSTSNQFSFYTSNYTGTISNVSLKEAVPDRSVKGNGLTVYGTPTVSAVATGAELKYTRHSTSSDYLAREVGSDFNFGTGDFCLMGWISQYTDGGSTQHPVQIGDITGSYSEISIVRQTSSSPMRLGFRVRGGTSSRQNYNIVGTDISANVFRNYALVRRSDKIEFYVDGVLKATDTNSTGSISFGSTNTIQIGQGDSTVTSDVMLNSLVRLSATAPTAEQIKDIYEAEKVLFYENAKCTLNGSSDSVTAMSYDDSNDELLVGTSGGLSVFKGLRRVDENTNAITEVAQQGGLRVEEY
jgi:hypothetical protein